MASLTTHDKPARKPDESQNVRNRLLFDDAPMSPARNRFQSILPQTVIEYFSVTLKRIIAGFRLRYDYEFP